MGYVEASNLFIKDAHGKKFAYREVGKKTNMPLILLTHLSAKLNGKSLGRPPLVEKNQLALQLYYENRFSVKEIATISGLATSTVYKIIKQEKEKPKN